MFNESVAIRGKFRMRLMIKTCTNGMCARTVASIWRNSDHMQEKQAPKVRWWWRANLRASVFALFVFTLSTCVLPFCPKSTRFTKTARGTNSWRCIVQWQPCTCSIVCYDMCAFKSSVVVLDAAYNTCMEHCATKHTSDVEYWTRAIGKRAIRASALACS